MWSIVETKDNGNVYVSAAPKKWIENNILYWPKTLVVNRRNPEDIQKGVWSEFRFTILKDDIGTYEEALAKEKFYSEHRNTESEDEKRVQKALKRKHPVNSNVSGGEIDVNNFFDTESNVKPSVTVNKKVKPKKMVPPKHNSVNGETLKKAKIISQKIVPKESQKKTATEATMKKYSIKPINSNGTSGTINRMSTSTSSAAPSSTFVPSSTIPISSYQTVQPIEGGMPIIQAVVPQDVFQQQTTELDEFTQLLTSNESNNFFTLPLTSLSLDTSTSMDQNSHHVLQTLRAPQQTNSDDLSRKIVNEIGTMFQTLLQEVGSLKQMLYDERKLRQEMEARLQANLDFINQNLSKNSNPFLSIDDEAMQQQFKLPITDWKTVPHFEKLLKTSMEFKENLTTKLSRIGGRDHSAKLRATTKRIIADDALQHFTWKGTNTKDPFIQFTLINNVIKDAINTDKEPYTDHDHNKCMKEYCKHAKTRLKSKAPRKQRKRISKKIVKKNVEVFSDENIETEENLNDNNNFDDEAAMISNDEENNEDETDTNSFGA